MKKSLIIALALMLVLAFATSAMAAQALNAAKTSYLSTASNSFNTDLKYDRNASKFNADNKTQYPYEIYLPNEMDPANYRIHSNYAKNTDACASCHATHTAVGDSLLQWYTAYDTCMACHDGTLGSATYNVLDGKIGVTSKVAYGGMFGLGANASKDISEHQGDTHVNSASNHNVTGLLDIASAPGGSTVGTTVAVGDEEKIRWTVEFGCQSCHTPHGQGGNARILHPDANFAASAAAEERTEPNKYYVNPVTAAVYYDQAFTLPAYIIKGYPYKPAIVKDDLAAPATYKISNISGSSIILKSGAPAVGEAIYVKNAVATLKVEMQISGYLTEEESVTHVSGMNFYCGACHTDYNTAAFSKTGSGKEETGVYSKAHRHQMGMDWWTPVTGTGLVLETTKTSQYAQGSMECLTCHVAHGTNQDFWAATLGGLVGADGTTWGDIADATEYEELAGSSALKRMPNMGTCEACHTKGDGSEGYNVNAGIKPAPTGFGILQGVNIAWLSAATYTGMESTTVSSCATCHREAVKEWAETQHNMFAPYNNDLTLTSGKRYLRAFNDETGAIGNSSEESIKLLDEFYAASEAYVSTEEPTTGLVGVLAQAKSVVLATYNNPQNSTLDATYLFSVGQLPVSSRRNMTATREYIIRYWNDQMVPAQWEYSVAGAAKWIPGATLGEGEWEIEGPGGLEGQDNYTGGCFNCHASLTTIAASVNSFAGVASNDDKAGNRALLDGWYNYLYMGKAKPIRDLGITCEACHGAASKHVANPMTSNIINPAKIDKKSSTRICGRCHTSSGNKGGLYQDYQPWKLIDTTPGSIAAGTVGTIVDLVYTTTPNRDSKGVLMDAAPTTFSYEYNNNAEKMDAYFKSAYESYEKNAEGEWVLPTFTTSSNKNWEASYMSKEGKKWGSGGHTQYSTFALNRHFADDIVACGSCHDSHSGAKGEFQLKLDNVEMICGACHSAGGNRMAQKYMPKQNGSGVRMHDFGKVIDSGTFKFKNIKLTAQPQYDKGFGSNK